MKLTAILICLGGSGDDVGILKLLNVLLSSDLAVSCKKKILQEDFNIEMTRTLESEVNHMCNLSKGVEEKGIERGMLASMRNLMKNMDLTLEQAMSALEIPERERQKYVDLLKGGDGSHPNLNA